MHTVIKICGAALAVTVASTPASAERIFGLTAGNTIVTFDSSTPGITKSSGTISGLGGDVLTGIDLRPATRQLYSLSTSGNLFRILKNASGADYTASLVGNIGTPLSGSRFGVDFNPVPDRLRFVTNNDQNLRINPDTGATLVDGNISAPGAETLVGVAYTNSRPGVTATTLYALESSGDRLLRSTNPNGGIYVDTNTAGVAFGPLGVQLGGTNNVGFDISGGSGAAFLSSAATFYRLDLTSGAATSIGTIGAGSLIGLTAGAVPEPASWAMMIAGFGLVGASMRRRAMTAVTA